MRADRKAFLRAAAAAIALCVLPALAAQDEATVRQYSVPGHGSLQLNVPKAWRVATKSLDDPASVLLRLGPGAGNAFHVQVTSLWLDAGKLAAKTPEQLRQDVERSGEKPLQQAVEKRLVVEELRGDQALGYYYSLTDRAPKAGEYKYLTQGIFVTGELLTIFTLLYHDANLAEKAQVLRMFASATHLAAGAAPKSEGEPAGTFSFDMRQPPLRLVVPDIPQMKMGAHPNAPAQPHALFMGTGEKGYSISVLMPTADAGMTAKDCAVSSHRSLVSRYGLDRKSVAAHQTNESTFVMLFPVRTGPLIQFKAYLLSGYGGTHCLEVHISRTVTARSQEAVSAELEAWYRGFREAKIEAY